MFERFTPSARRAVERACEEAALLGHGFVGTEHLLLALVSDDGDAGGVLAAFGVSRERLFAQYRGPNDACGPPPGRRPDPDALASVGIDLNEVRRHVEDTFGRGVLERTRAWSRTVPAFTPRARRGLDAGVRAADDLGDRDVEPVHLLLGIVAVRDAVAARLLARHGASASRVRAAVAEARRRPA